MRFGERPLHRRRRPSHLKSRAGCRLWRRRVRRCRRSKSSRSQSTSRVHGASAPSPSRCSTVTRSSTLATRAAARGTGVADDGSHDAAADEDVGAPKADDGDVTSTAGDDSSDNDDEEATAAASASTPTSTNFEGEASASSTPPRALLRTAARARSAAMRRSST